MKRRLFMSLLFSSLLGIFISFALVTVGAYQERLSEMKQQAKDYANYFDQNWNRYDLQNKLYIPNSWNFRITLINSDGIVKFDSHTDISAIENHGQRDEFLQAQENGYGESLRHSATKDTDTYYYAVKLSSGEILRVSGEISSVWNTVDNLIPWVLLAIISAVLLLLIYAKLQTNRLVKPINKINLSRPLENDVYDEISPLLRRIHQQNGDLALQMADIQKQKKELSTIMEHLQEGLVILDRNGNILSINQSAERLFSISEQCMGRNYLDILRQPELSEGVCSALRGNSQHCILNLSNRWFQVYINPVMQQQEIDGVLLLFQDVTQKQQNEQMRREFTANVSHELKTPLTSISGYAELLSGGIAKREDILLFSERIYNESKRLIKLVEDIIHISQLDEQELLLEEQRVNLYSLAIQVKKQLDGYAKTKNITYKVKGDPDVVVLGVPAILEEIIRNLCDNGIKYNRTGGKLTIEIYKEEQMAVLAVVDTGQGIPLEYHERIFERFFCVDKSHSRKSGGTGLGLSIVKHGVQYHKGSYSLSSKPGEGTSIIIKIPLENSIQEEVSQ